MHNFGLVHIDTNSKFPNLVLMKLSSWIKHGGGVKVNY